VLLLGIMVGVTLVGLAITWMAIKALARQWR